MIDAASSTNGDTAPKPGEYPQGRSKFFANRVCRYLAKPSAARNRAHCLCADRHHCPPGRCKAV